MKHEISVSWEVDCEAEALVEQVIETTIMESLKAENLQFPCEINVLITDDVGIRDINRQQRDIDKATDVLSFPMFELKAGIPPEYEGDLDPTHLLPLGDIVLSMERAVAQGEEYGHGLFREIVYLTVHSILHLLGYDHLDEGVDKKQMREREKAILAIELLERFTKEEFV